MYAMSGDEISDRLIVGLESFLSLAIAFLSTVTGAHIPPLSTPAICHLYGSDSPTTEFFLEKSVYPEDDVCVASDWLVVLFQFLVCHAVSWWSRWLLWEPMAKWYFHVPQHKLPEISRAVVSNLFYVLSIFAAWRILTPHEWLYSPKEWSRGLDDPTVAPELKFFYLLYAARYTSDFISLLYEPKQTHTWAYAMNHAVSTALVVVSATAGYIRIGCVMMLFVDWADPFFLTTKLALYAHGQSDGYHFIANGLLKVLSVVFALTRMILLNSVVWIALREVSEEARFLKICGIVLALLQTFSFFVTCQTAARKTFENGHIRSDNDTAEPGSHNKRTVRMKHQ